MKVVGVGVMCLIITLTASHVVAQTVSARDLEQFLEQYMDSVRSSDSADWKDLLYAAAGDGGTPEAVIARFAERIGVSNETAGDYAWIILETSVLKERCAADARGRRPADCVFAPGQRRYDRAASLGRGERGGHLLFAVARSGAFTMQDEAALVALIRTHPAAPAIFARMFERRRDASLLLALAAFGPLPERLSLLAATSNLSYFRWSKQDDTRRLALLESVEASAVRNKSSATTRAALAQIGLWWKLELGLNDDAVASYYAYPDDVRALLPIPGGCLDTVERCFPIDRYRLSDELAAALWLTGHTDDARRLLRQALPGFGSRTPVAETRYRALSDAVSPAYSADDLFPLFVDGALPGQAEKPGGRIGFQSPNGSGWVFVTRAAGPAVRRVIAGRLRTAGYGSMASYLEQPDRPTRSAAVDAVLQTVAGMFPKSLSGRQTYWLARIDASAAQRTQATPEPVRVVTRRPPAWWTERRLPASTRPWRDTDVMQALPDDADLPVDREAVARYEERDGERAIVYFSTEYDLPYLTRTAGIWFARTVRGVWSPPLYLGLQQHFPYVVTPGSRLPLLDGQRLRIEVQVREMDAAAFGYPLVFALKRSADGLYLDVDLAAVAADRDGDGLTDIAEWRIGLDFTRADTDGDGIVDGRDPLPLVAYRSAPATDQLARAIVTTIFSDEPGPTVAGVAPTVRETTTGDRPDEAARPRGRTRFLIGDPSMFAGLATSFPLIVYSRADIALLDRGEARRYPAQVTHIFSSLDGRTHHVGWSAAGAGGSFVVTCNTTGDACSVKTTGMWIT